MVGELPKEPKPYLAAEMHGQRRTDEGPEHKNCGANRRITMTKNPLESLSLLPR
jgi:hypothetical protein